MACWKIEETQEAEIKKSKSMRSKETNCRTKGWASITNRKEDPGCTCPERNPAAWKRSLTYLALSPKNVPVEYFLEIHQESFNYRDNSAGYQDLAVWNGFSETGQYLIGPLS